MNYAAYAKSPYVAFHEGRGDSHSGAAPKKEKTMYSLNESELLRVAHVRATANLPREIWIDHAELNRKVAQARTEAMRNTFHGLARIFGRIKNAIAEHRRYRAGVAELEALDTRTLDDIGISRADIPRVAAGLWAPEAAAAKLVAAPASAGNENARKVAA